MRVMVTGGTGFVGSHTVRAFQEAGHTVRLLARSPERAERILGERGIRVPEITAGDMTDADAVRRALQGCDAAFHAAALMYGGHEVLAANVAGVRNVLGIARELALDPIVYVSTVAAMFPPPGDVITVDDPIVNLETTYGRSKAEGERIARDLQAQGVPVVILYPGGVYGPDDPVVGEATKGLRDGLRYVWPVTTSGVSVVDVRDLAHIAVEVLEPGRGPRRFMAGGHFVTWSEKADLLEALTGRRLRRIPAPPRLLEWVGRVLDAAKRVRYFEYPLTHEATQVMTRFVPCDSRRTVEELGVDFRPTAETLADAIRWLYQAGELTAEQAGKLAAPPPGVTGAGGAARAAP